MTSAQSLTQSKGLPVWLDMDQEALDDAYDQDKYAPNRAQVVERRIANSERARALLGMPSRLAYGASPIEALDVFRTAKAHAPINIFIHGGAWRRNRASDYALQAEMFVNAGAHHVVLDFVSIDDVGGNLFALADQVRRAIAWVYRNATTFGGDPDQIYLSGHSSGAHLGGCMVTTDWRKEGLPADVIKGAVLCSGMYELAPVRLSKRSLYVKFTDEMEHALSAQRHLDKLVAPLVLVYGTYETPEFQRQTREFFSAVQSVGKSAKLLVGEGYNHFEMLDTLANPYGLAGRAALAQMQLP